MAMTRPEIRSPQLPVGITAVGPQFPLSTGYYWIGQAETQLTEQRVEGIAIYNAQECHFLHAEDALSILYFLRAHEETLLRQTRITFDLPVLSRVNSHQNGD